MKGDKAEALNYMKKIERKSDDGTADKPKTIKSAAELRRE